MALVICEKCFSVDRPRKIKRGSWKIEAVSWAFFPFGLPYAIWRSVTKQFACRQCGHRSVFRKDSPQGKALQSQFDREIATTSPIATTPPSPAPAAPFIAAPMSPAPTAAPAPQTNYSAARDPNVW